MLAIAIIFLQFVSGAQWFCNPSTNWCYTVSIHHGNNAAAKAFCRSFDAELVSIETVDENWYVARLCHWQSCWIGLEEKGEGQWS